MKLDRDGARLLRSNVQSVRAENKFHARLSVVREIVLRPERDD